MANETKTDMIGVMVTPLVKDFVRDLSESEERSISYIAGHFLMRGIAQYLRDGMLKEPEPPTLPQSREVTSKAATRTEKSSATKKGGGKNTQVLKGAGVILDTTRKVKN